MPGAAVQTAVTPDGHWVAVSLYDDKSVALYDSRAGALIARIPLYSSAKGPVQSYPSPDGRFLYVADQGHYEVARLAAGKEPNGISLWHRQFIAE